MTLVVISRGRGRPEADVAEERAWCEAHRWLATLSNRSLHLIAENCGHNLGQPGLYRLAMKQVLAMLNDKTVVPREPGRSPQERRV